MISKQAKQMSLENDLSPEINQAYIDNVGSEYATAEQVQEAYVGEFDNDVEFAQELADQLGLLDKEIRWPFSCIDWERAARELMYDYFEVDNYYFRNL